MPMNPSQLSLPQNEEVQPAPQAQPMNLPIGTPPPAAAAPAVPQYSFKENFRRNMMAKMGRDPDKEAADFQARQNAVHLADPTSPHSRKAQNFVKTIFGAVMDEDKKKFVDGLSAADIKAFGLFDVMEKMTKAKQDRDMLELKNKQDEAREAGRNRRHQENLGVRQSMQKDRLDEKKEDRSEKQQEKLSKRLVDSGVQTLEESIQQIESLIGGLDGSKTADKGIPGYGATRIVPGFMLSGKGQRLRNLVGGLANVQLKQRSGAAVTTQEMKRFLEEFGAGMFSSDENLRIGLERLKKAVARDKASIEAGYAKEVQNEYERRQGQELGVDFTEGFKFGDEDEE